MHAAIANLRATLEAVRAIATGAVRAVAAWAPETCNRRRPVPPEHVSDEIEVDRTADNDRSEYFTDLELRAQAYDWKWQPGTTRTPIGARPRRG